MRFLLQSDPDVCLLEQRAVRHAALVAPGGCTASDYLRRSLDDLSRLAPGEAAADRDFCPVGTVEFCRAWMRAAGVAEPEPIDYPAILRPALQRWIRKTIYWQAAVGSWIKPVRTKAWEPHAKQGDREHPAGELVWETPFIHEQDWLAEWRVYVIGGRIVGWGRYDDKPSEHDLRTDVVSVWVDAYTASGEAPAGYALDVALWPRNQLVLVEASDGWSIGYYKGDCSPTDYARLLMARWRQMSGARS